MKADYLVMAALAAVISGCGIPAGDLQGITPNEAYDNMARAQTAYATCLQQVGPDEAVTCDGYKRLYDRDKQIYQSASAGITGRQLLAGSPLLDAIAD